MGTEQMQNTANMEGISTPVNWDASNGPAAEISAEIYNTAVKVFVAVLLQWTITTVPQSYRIYYLLLIQNLHLVLT